VEIIRCIEDFYPGLFLQLVVGVLAAISRVSYDAKSCEHGPGVLLLIFSRQLFVSVSFVIVANGVVARYGLDRPISISIVLLVGFFAKEVIEQIKIIITKIPCLVTKMKIFQK